MFRRFVFISAALLLSPSYVFADYDPEGCRIVAGTFNISWEAIAGSTAPCTGIETTDGTMEDAADGSISMSGVSVSNADCIGLAAYEFTLSMDGSTLTGADTANQVDMVLTREPGEGCFHGNWTSGDMTYVAQIAGDVFAEARPPQCGDVNDSGKVNASDALLVLKKGVGQELELSCSRYGYALDDCEFALANHDDDLETCSGELQTCTGELEEAQANLAAYQPISCPCWSGPAKLAKLLTDNVTGVPTADFDEDCQLVNGAGTHYFGIESDDSFPLSPVSGDGKCRSAVGVQVDYMQSAASPRCLVERFVYSFGFETLEPDTDCEGLPAFEEIDIRGLTTQQLDACAAQLPVAASLIPACAP